MAVSSVRFLQVDDEHGGGKPGADEGSEIDHVAGVDHALDHVAVQIGQSQVASSVEEGEAFVIEAKQMKYGGMEVSEARRLRELEAENAKLKRIVADQMLDMSAIKDLLAKNW